VGIARLHGLGRWHDQAFSHNVGRAVALPELLSFNLTGLGDNSIGHRRKLLAFPYLTPRPWDAVCGIHRPNRGCPRRPPTPRNDTASRRAHLLRNRFRICRAGGEYPAARSGSSAVFVAFKATKPIPIIIGTDLGGDPVNLGLAANLARLGDNITGFLHGRPGDLPIHRSVKFEFVVDFKTLSLLMPTTLLACADEVVE